ncbi:hypothetical protein ID866_13248 [Astraeus odoratus]|nr:hypothetical protein ID866_13248 [Astraeus odoratus]
MGIEPVDTKAPAGRDFTAIFKKVVTASEKAKTAMKLQADKRRNPTPDYQVLRATLNAVELKLPKSLRIHLVVNVSRVKPYRGPLPGQPVHQPGPVHVTEERDEEYEVDHIIDSRMYKGKLQYLVHWKGYRDEEHTWEPQSNLQNAPDALKEFVERNL